MRLASDTRRAGPMLPGLRSSSGLASRSARAALSTSALLMLRRRAQSPTVMPCTSAGVLRRWLGVLFAVLGFFTLACPPGRDDAFAGAALGEADRKEHVPDKAGQEHAVFVGFIEVEPINGTRIGEGEPRQLERDRMVAKIARGLPIVPFEFIVPRPILVCRIAEDDKADPIGPITFGSMTASACASGALRTRRPATASESTPAMPDRCR